MACMALAQHKATSLQVKRIASALALARQSGEEESEGTRHPINQRTAVILLVIIDASYN